jgi:hypothetical protein
MTPIHESLSLYKSAHNHTKARGYCRVPKIGIPKTSEESAPPLKNHIHIETGHPRLRSDLHEDALTPRKIFDLHDPRSSEPALPHPPTYRQKLRHLMQSPTTSYPHGYNTASMEAVPVSNLAFYYPSRDGQ